MNPAESPSAPSVGSGVVGIDPGTLSIDSILLMPFDSATVIGATNHAVIGAVDGLNHIFRLDPTTGRRWLGGSISVHGSAIATFADEVWSADTRGNLWRTSISTGRPLTPSSPAQFVRSCADSVYGRLPAGWKRDSVVAGPIAFVGLRAAAVEPPKYFAHHVGGFGGGLAVVSPGRVVTVRVPSSEAGRVALLYDPSVFGHSGLYSLLHGEQSVTFQACRFGQSPYPDANGGTVFTGSVIVAGAQCVTLDVTPAGEPMRQVRIPFGKGTCQ
jgi:hypothetical protein